MPKIFGTSLLGILAATVAFFAVGWLWYGALFMEKWATLTGVPMDGEMQMGPMLGGLLITLVQVVGLSFILQHAGASVLKTCVKICAIVAVLIALPIIYYGQNYEGRALDLFWIDASHMLVGYIVVGLVLSFFRGKDAIGED